MENEVPIYASLLQSGKYSDMVIECGSLKFNVHKAVVCPQSAPFAAMIDGNFQESHDSTIVLRDDDPIIVEKAITFLYTSDYSDERKSMKNMPGTNEVMGECLIINTEMYIFADRWAIHKLKPLATRKYKHYLLTNRIDKFFVSSLEAMFDNLPDSDRELKDVAIKNAARRYTALITLESFRLLCQKSGNIGFEILSALAGGC